jgi:hypothetical protein
MKRAFIRGLWGIYEHDGRRFFKRRTKLDKDMDLVRLNKNAENHITYVFGEDNYKFLIDQGFEARLVDKRPIVWDMDNEQFRHKLEVLHQGMQEFDEIVFLDWDCTECRPIPDNFWERLSEKAEIQAVLRQYKKKKINWRPEHQRKMPEASFVYINNKETTKNLNELWEKMGRPWSEELVIAKYMDNLSGGWQSLDYYYEHYEPFFATWGNCKAPSAEALAEGYQYLHINERSVARLLRRSHKDSNKLTKMLKR